MSLTQVDVESYGRDGHLFPIRVFDGETAAHLLGRVEALEHAGRTASTIRRPLIDYFRANLHIVSRFASDIARAPAILDVVETILGPDLMVWMTELIIKEPHSGKFLSMHQDLTYWGMGENQDEMTAWVALTDTTIDNGCMSFVSGSHLRGQMSHIDTFEVDNLLSRGQTVAVEFDPADEVPVELSAGEMSLHHGHMVHGSSANGSARRRVGVVIRYITPAVVPEVSRTDYAMVVRGANRTNNFVSVGEPDGDFTPSGVALFEEITSAQMTALAEGTEDGFTYAR